MSVLDQAFIKAFSRQNAAPSLQPKPVAPAPLPRKTASLLNDFCDSVASGRAPMERAAAKKKDESIGAVLAALERTPIRPAPVIKAAAGLSPSETIADGGLCAIANAVWPAESQSWTVEALPWMPESPPSSSDDNMPCEAVVETIPLVPTSQAVAPTAEQRPGSPPVEQPAQQTCTESKPTIEKPADQVRASSNLKMFRPAWQVERFSWPRVCRRLMSRASGEWDRLVEAVLAVGDEGRKVLAIAANRRGEGATTVLLCVARRLAERGVRTALADADLGRPRLAKRLGVQAQCGWDETADGGVEQAVIEAERGALALLTLREPTANLPGNWRRWPECIDALRNRYQSVLIDPGPLERIGEELPPWAADGAADAVLLVHNRRITSEGELQHLRRRLTAAGVPVAGVIENFVAE
jgi:Mrp family chromosome partitioning ATPase